MNEPVAVIGDTCAQAHCFTEVIFTPHEKDGRRWMLMGVYMECRGKEIPCTIEEIRKLRDSLSEWLGEKP